jgi:hypothetical protein
VDDRIEGSYDLDLLEHHKYKNISAYKGRLKCLMGK